MSNMNTFAQVQNLTANATATETAVAAVAGGTTRQILGLTNDVVGSLFDGQPFKIRVVTQGVASGAGNLVTKLYWNSAANTNLTTFTSDVAIFTATDALSSKSGVSFFEVICLWDSTLQQLSAMNNAAAGFSGATVPTVNGSTAVLLGTSGVVTTTGVGVQSLLQFFVTTSISANGTSAKLLELSFDQI